MAWLREPLVHFLGLGLLLFLIFEGFGGDSTGEDVIVVDERLLAQVVSYRDPRLSGEAALVHIRQLDADERARLVDDAIREEVLYREALALGLDENDYATKRRLIAQLDYLNRGTAYDQLELSSPLVAEHYEEHRERYRLPQRLTFTHVFFRAEDSDDVTALQEAQAELLWLNDSALPFHQSASRGDRFLYQRNYVDKTLDEVAAHFGADFAGEVFAMEESPKWRGPVRSAYGLHLVRVADSKPSSIPPLDDLRDQVVDDLSRQLVESKMEDDYRLARTRYRIVVEETQEPAP